MISVLVTLEVDSARVEYFLECLRYQAQASRAEPGCRRWEMSRKLDQPNVFTLSELFDDAAALPAHYNSPHFARWIERTGGGLIVSKTSVRGEVMDG